MAATIERSGAASAQFNLEFPEGEAGPPIRSTRRTAGRSSAEARPPSELSRKKQATTLDRVHMAMLLQANGASNALRSLLEEEQNRSQDFLRLANALSALYPKSEEKRLLEAMLQAVPKR
jgi:putative cell wall-binding protein